MATELDPLTAWRAVLLAQNRAVRAIEQDLERAGVVSLWWYDVLLELNAARGHRLRMQELAVRAVLSRTRISRIVTELGAAGLVEREPDPADGRATLATITRAGQTALRKAVPVYLTAISEHFTRHLTVAQQQAIARGLQRVIDAHSDPRR